jgi:hypothetical protein
MNNNLKLQLVESLLKFDFFFLESKSLNKKNRYIKSCTQFHKLDQVNYKLLSPEESIKMFKQSLRILQFLQGSNNSTLYLNFKNINFSDLMNFLLKDAILTKNNTVTTRKISKNSLLNKSVNSAFFFDFINKSKNYKTLFSNDLYLINEINTFIERNDFGVYKTFNSSNNWKRVVLYYLLLKSVYQIK